MNKLHTWESNKYNDPIENIVPYELVSSDNTDGADTTDDVQENNSDNSSKSVITDISDMNTDRLYTSVYPYNLYTDNWGAEYRAEFIQAVPIKNGSFGLLYKINLRGQAYFWR